VRFDAAARAAARAADGNGGRDMRLWIGNMAPGTTDDEIKALVVKYAPSLECGDVERVEGTGTHPAAIVAFTGGTSAELGNLALRLNGLYWKGRSLNCNTLMR
jgi:hypothetical protein